MLGLSRIFAALTISCSVANSLSRPLAMVPPTRETGAGFCASTGPRQTRGPFRNAAIGARLSPRTIGGSMASQSVGGAAAVRKSATAEIRVKPINGFIGAEIEGDDLPRPLSPPQFKIVTDALAP